MASFTDSEIQLAPYVQQLPIEAMVRTGVQREQQYQEGIQTTQNIFDSLLNLPMLKQGTKDYVKQRVGQLNKAISQSISGDFSDRRFTNQISGLASQISSDPIVQNEVQSTARIQAGYAKQKADQERALKEGKNPVNNINDYNEQVNAWMSDGKINTPFQSDYTPYIDVVGEVIKLYKEQNEGEDVPADAIRIGRDGKTVEYNPTLMKGLSPERIQNTINLVMQRPDVRQQLGVDGRQNYKAYTPQMLADEATKSTNDYIDRTEAAINKLKVTRTTDGTANVSDINKQIKELEKQADGVTSQFKEDMELLVGNADGYKSELVKRHITNNFLGAYANQTLVENPLWNQAWKITEFNEKVRMNNWEMEKYDLEMKAKLLKAQADARALLPGYIAVPDVVDDDLGKVTEATANQQLTDLNTNWETEFRKQTSVIASNSDLPAPYKLIDGIYQPNINTDPTKGYTDKDAARAAASKIMIEAGTGYVNGKPSPMAKDAIKTLSRISDDAAILKQNIEETGKNTQPQLDALEAKMGADYFSIYSVQQRLPGWEQKLKQLVSKYYKGDYSGTAMDVVKNQIDASLSPAGYIQTKQQMEKIGLSMDDYSKSVKSIKNEDLSFLETRKQDFRNMQGVYNTKAVELTHAKEGEEAIIAQSFDPILRAVNVGRNPVRGDAAKFRRLMDTNIPGTEGRKYYYTGLDKKTGLGWIEIRTGKSKDGVRIDNIPEDFYYQSLVKYNLQTDDSFDYEFGSKLAQTNWWTTDVLGTGKRDAIVLDLPTGAGYSVLYHLAPGSNPGTNYNIKTWITRDDGTVLEDGRPFTLGGDATTTNLDRAGVLDLLEKLKDPKFLKSYDMVINAKPAAPK